MIDTIFNEKSRRILLVDESIDWADRFIDNLKEFSVSILLARDERQGLEVIRRSRVDLAVIAEDSPRVGGMELVRRMHWFSADLPVIVVSNRANARWMIEALQIGVRTVLPRPVDVERLIEMSEKILGMC